MTLKVVILSAVIVILIILPQISKRVIYKKLTQHLANREYEEFEKLLDGFIATFSFRPYNREYMRLNAYFMQGDKQKIEEQLDNMWNRIRMKGVQKAAVAKQGFYFYLEQQKYDKAKKMLDYCVKEDTNANEVHVMDMMYTILALKQSDYIAEIRERLDYMRKESDAYTNTAKKVRIGVFEYLLGLQYSYQNNKKASKTCLESALKNCQNTPYEVEIKKLLGKK